MWGLYSYVLALELISASIARMQNQIGSEPDLPALAMSKCLAHAGTCLVIRKQQTFTNRSNTRPRLGLLQVKRVWHTRENC